MENILYNISQVLGIAIIHSLWQGLLIYFLLRMALLLSGQLTSSKKYMLATGSLFAITAWFIYTLVNEIQIYNWLAVKPEKLSAIPYLLNIPAGIRQFNDQGIRYYYSIEEYLPYVTAIYVAGLLFNTTRLLLARKKINFIKRTMSIAVQLQQQVSKFERLLGISTRVKIGLSNLIDVSCIVGFFKPVILLPISLSTYLSPEEVEAILLHELAHVKRNDYIINLLQQIIAILLFFNPCAQLINRIINEERENCCDDLVVKVTANPLIYAKALLKLEQNRQTDWQLALAATGKKYHLLNRIERIMKTKNHAPSIRPALLAMLILTIGISSIALLNPEIAQGKISVKKLSPVLDRLLADTTHKAKVAVQKKKKITSKQAVAKKVSRENLEYNSAADQRKLDELNAEIQRHSEAVNSFYNSESFKATQRELELKSRELQDLYSNPDLKKLQEESARLGEQFSKNWTDNDKLKSLTDGMGEAGKNIGAYYSSPEFKKMNEELEKKYGIPHNRHYYNDLDEKDENYRKYEAELESRLPPEIKKQTDQLKKMGDQMTAQYVTPEFKAQSERMRIMADSLGKAFSGTSFKLKQEEMKQIESKFRAYQNNPQLKKELELLQQSVNKMTAYINSPEYKRHLEQLKRISIESADWDNHQEKPEKPQKQESNN